MLNIAIQAARGAAFLAPHAPKIIMAAKTLGFVVATDTIINEFVRYGSQEQTAARNARRAAREAASKEQPATNAKERGAYRIPNYPGWKKTFDIRPDESFKDSTKRHTRTVWEIICFAAGDALAAINVVTVKLVKLALGLAGGILAIATSLVALIPVGLLRLCRAMSKETFEKSLDNIVGFTTTVFLAPFVAVRWVDRKVMGLVQRMKAPRAFRNAQARAAAAPTAAEGSADGMANVTHIFHFVIDTEAAKADPKAYGRRIFNYEMAQEGLQLAATHRKTSLPLQLRTAGLAEGVVSLVLQGYDEAVIDAAASTSTPAAATS